MRGYESFALIRALRSFCLGISAHFRLLLCGLTVIFFLGIFPGVAIASKDGAKRKPVTRADSVTNNASSIHCSTALSETDQSLHPDLERIFHLRHDDIKRQSAYWLGRFPEVRHIDVEDLVAEAVLWLNAILFDWRPDGGMALDAFINVKIKQELVEFLRKAHFGGRRDLYWSSLRKGVEETLRGELGRGPNLEEVVERIAERESGSQSESETGSVKREKIERSIFSSLSKAERRREVSRYEKFDEEAFILVSNVDLWSESKWRKGVAKMASAAAQEEVDTNLKREITSLIAVWTQRFLTSFLSTEKSTPTFRRAVVFAKLHIMGFGPRELKVLLGIEERQLVERRANAKAFFPEAMENPEWLAKARWVFRGQTEDQRLDLLHPLERAILTDVKIPGNVEIANSLKRLDKAILRTARIANNSSETAAMLDALYDHLRGSDIEGTAQLLGTTVSEAQRLVDNAKATYSEYQDPIFVETIGYLLPYYERAKREKARENE
jgi:hypothetical protein